MVVWMLAAVDTGRVAVIVIITYVVGLAELTHIIAGSVEVLFLVMVGARSWISVVWGYLVPTLLGNIVGGVSLTAAVNHAQVVAGMNKRAASLFLTARNCAPSPARVSIEARAERDLQQRLPG